MPTRYTVAPTQQAINQLARLWTQASSADRSAITRASNRIDAELRQDADQKGIPMPGLSPISRRLQISPLRAYYEVIKADRLVTILDYEQVS